jgi:ribosome-associated protein
MSKHKKNHTRLGPSPLEPDVPDDATWHPDLGAAKDGRIEGGQPPAMPLGGTARQGTAGRPLRPRDQAEEPCEEAAPLSKTRIKKQMHELRDLGKELTELSKEQLAQLHIPEKLREAILEAKSINKFGAQRRQLQYIGKLMREVDRAPIVTKLDAWKGKSQQHSAHMHQLERWRTRLMESDSALTELLASHPSADAQQLRALIRNAQKEVAAGKPPRSFREIFRVLREIIAEPS